MSPKNTLKIQNLRERFFGSIQGKSNLLRIIDESEVHEQVYNSNAIENSTLTLEETEKILLQIDLDRFVTQREVFEAKNLARVVEYITTKSLERELDLETILLLHKMLISNIRDDIAGRFRIKEWVRVGSFVAPSPDEVIDRLTSLLLEYKANTKDSIVTRITKFHLGFEYIHPFVDGNGRIGRVLNNYLLIREGYVPVNISIVSRAEYYDSFREFQNNSKNISIMENLILASLVNSYYKRLAYLENKKIITLQEYSKTSRDSYNNLLNKSSRQTIESFRERGIWKIGV